MVCPAIRGNFLSNLTLVTLTTEPIHAVVKLTGDIGVFLFTADYMY